MANFARIFLTLGISGMMFLPAQPLAAKAKEKTKAAPRLEDVTEVKAKDSAEDGKSQELAKKDIGIGLGILSIALPAVGGELTYTYHTRFTVALESGALQLSLPETKIQSKFSAIHLRYAFSEGMPFFLGFAYAQQDTSIESVTDATIAVVNEGTASSEEAKESIAWTVKLKQPLVIPHVGWMWMWESGAALTLGLGVQIPVGTKLTVTNNASATTQVSAEQIADAEKEKTDQVKQYLDTPLPYFAIKFNWFLDTF
jgi:hypothetical protein